MNATTNRPIAHQSQGGRRRLFLHLLLPLVLLGAGLFSMLTTPASTFAAAASSPPVLLPAHLWKSTPADSLPMQEARPACQGTGCTGLDPIAEGCDQDALTTASSRIVYSGSATETTVLHLDPGMVVGLVERRFSPSCQASWGRVTTAVPALIHGILGTGVDLRIHPETTLSLAAQSGHGFSNTAYSNMDASAHLRVIGTVLLGFPPGASSLSSTPPLFAQAEVLLHP